MKTPTALLLTLALFAATACALSPAHPDPAPEQKALLALLPGDGAVPDWKRSAPPEFHGPENLWDCINGAAVLYLDYGFAALISQSYATEDKKASAQIEIYRMESPLHAFAIYAAERSPEDEPIEIGAEGYRTGNLLNFWKGPYYTKVSSYNAVEASEGLLRSLAGIVADRIPGRYSEPQTFRLFPAENRVPGSERYIPKNFLGHPFFEGGYRVDYQGEKTKCQLFLVPNASTKEAQEAFERYRKYLEAQGSPVTLEREADYQIMRVDRQQTIFQYESFVGGVLGETDEANARKLAEETLDLVKMTRQDKR